MVIEDKRTKKASNRCIQLYGLSTIDQKNTTDTRKFNNNKWKMTISCQEVVNDLTTKYTKGAHNWRKLEWTK